MRLPVPFSGLRRRHSRRLARAFTLVEIIIALTVFLFVIAGVLFAHIYGLKMFQMTNTKLLVTQWTRETVENLADQIHACTSVTIGNMDTNGNFTGLLNGETQVGNGLQIYFYSTGETNTYFVNLADQTFRLNVGTSNSSSTVILANSVTNVLPFSGQDFSGNILTNSQNNQVTHVTLEFYHPASYLVSEDYYKLETSAKQRLVQ